MNNDKHQALRDALNKAFRFGQEYGSQADSESYSENRRSYETQAKFEAMREDIIRTLLADHDRMRDALQYIATLDAGLMSGTPDPIGSLAEAAETAREALQEATK